MAAMNFSEIEDFAAGVIEKHGVNPGDVMALARSAKIEVKSVSFQGDDVRKSGYIAKTNGTVVIHVNADHAETRQRFTVAHELGHYFLNHLETDSTIVDDEAVGGSGLVLNRSPDGMYTEKEVQANRFAAAILMPKHMVEHLWQGFPFVPTLAKAFGVSEHAMTIRLQVLGLI